MPYWRSLARRASRPRPIALLLLTAGTIFALAPVSSSPAGQSGLSDGRVYEQVSEKIKNGNEAGILIRSGRLSPGVAIATTGGAQILYEQLGPSGETSSGTDLFGVAGRSATAWETVAALPPGYGVNASFFQGEEPRSIVPSADLSHMAFSATGSFGAGNFGVDGTGRESGAGSYRAAVDSQAAELWLSKPTIPTPFPNPITGSWPHLLAGSPTLETVYFTYWGTLVPEDESRAPHVTASLSTSAWSIYEWSDGTLRSAALLPNETYSPYGAVPAGSIRREGAPTLSPDFFRNEITPDGSELFFLSPAPEQVAKAESETKTPQPPELYVREQTPSGPRSVLASRSELPGHVGEAAPGTGVETAVTPVNGATSAYVYVSPDGSRAFFASKDQLTESAPENTAVKEYEFNLATEETTYLAEIAEPASKPFSNVFASSEDGSALLFENAAAHKIDLWSSGAPVAEVGSFSTPSNPELTAARATSDGSAFVFGTNAVLVHGSETFNNSSAHLQIYRYEPSSAKLVCLSCGPEGSPQSAARTTQRRVLADEGDRVFFATPAKLVPQDVNGVEDVYEWEQEGVDNCAPGQPDGCLYLTSSGTSPEPSFYLDNSESGDDVFFATLQGLDAEDTDGSYDVYDARVDGGFPRPLAPAGCEEGCQGPPTSFSAPAPLTMTVGPADNLAPPTPSVTPPKPRPKSLTRAQKLARALKACHRDPKKKRASCVKRAQRLYGAKRPRHDAKGGSK
ncbi:MAG TPA: hypothetical protein VFW38_10500 [Solirubrobacteraceae bacterium]|nr:hypothetical protein [Solirubrobacteraceae bacterium]